jgi:hypothetical protein
LIVLMHEALVLWLSQAGGEHDAGAAGFDLVNSGVDVFGYGSSSAGGLRALQLGVGCAADNARAKVANNAAAAAADAAGLPPPPLAGLVGCAADSARAKVANNAAAAAADAAGLPVPLRTGFVGGAARNVAAKEANDDAAAVATAAGLPAPPLTGFVPGSVADVSARAKVTNAAAAAVATAAGLPVPARTGFLGGAADNVVAKVTNAAAAAVATAAGLPAPPRTGFAGAAASNVAAAEADDWAGALFAVPAVLPLVVKAFLREGVQLRKKDKAANEKWKRAKSGWADRLAPRILAELPKSEAGALLLASKYAGPSAATDLATRLSVAVNMWQKGRPPTPLLLKEAAKEVGIKCHT